MKHGVGKSKLAACAVIMLGITSAESQKMWANWSNCMQTTAIVSDNERNRYVIKGVTYGRSNGRHRPSIVEKLVYSMPSPENRAHLSKEKAVFAGWLPDGKTGECRPASVFAIDVDDNSMHVTIVGLEPGSRAAIVPVRSRVQYLGDMVPLVESITRPGELLTELHIQGPPYADRYDLVLVIIMGNSPDTRYDAYFTVFRNEHP